MKKIIITEQQLDHILESNLKAGRLKSILAEIYGPEMLNEDEAAGDKYTERANFYNGLPRFKKYPQGVFKRIYNFGAYGLPEVALAETKNGCFVFIDRTGRMNANFKIDMKKIMMHMDIFAGWLNSLIGVPRYKEVVNIYDDCTMKVIDVHDNVILIDPMTGEPLKKAEGGDYIGREHKICPTMYNGFIADPDVIKKAERLSNKSEEESEAEHQTQEPENDVAPMRFSFK